MQKKKRQKKTRQSDFAENPKSKNVLMQKNKKSRQSDFAENPKSKNGSSLQK